MSSQKLLNVRIFRPPQRFVVSAEINTPLTHHHDLAVYQAKSFTFTFENYSALIVNDGILRTYVLQIVHLMRNKNRRNIFEIPKLHCELTDRSRGWWI